MKVSSEKVSTCSVAETAFLEVEGMFLQRVSPEDVSVLLEVVFLEDPDHG